MSLTTYSSLYPTGDVVQYDNTNVEYPASNVVDTFGQIWVSKVHGYDMNILELASAGKISFTPSNEHSLDLLLETSLSNIKLQARNQNSLVLDNEDSTGNFTISDTGSATISAVSGANVLQMDTSGNLFQAGGTGSNLFIVPSGSSHCFEVGTTEVMCIEETGASISNLTVNGTDFLVPRGPQASRPVGTNGQIYYNEDTGRFEGFASDAWGGLGGTVDVDGDTYVSAETTPGADNDQLIFYTAGVERLRIDSTGQVGYGTTTPQYDMDWNGDVQFTTSDSNVLRLDTSGLFVDTVSGSNYFGVEAGQQNTFEVGGTEIVTIDSSGLSSSNLTVNGTSFLAPRGTLGERPVGTNGQIYYNETTGRFEGFASDAWSGLGGTIDVDQNTYVSAEDSPGADNNELKFVTAGEERFRVTDTGFLGYGTSNPEYTIDIIGDLRVSGSIIAANSSIGDNGNVLELGIPPGGTSDVIDGSDTNSGSGLKVVGVPDTPLFSSTVRSRFDKSLTWEYNQSGMQTLGHKDAWTTESYWKMRGGAFRLSHTNVDSGAEVEFIMRVNDQDEFQIVRHVVPVNGETESYDVIAKFGNKTSATNRVSAEQGFAVLDADLTSMDTGAGTVDAYIETFSAYSAYTVHAALFPTSATPTTAEVVAAAATNGYVSGTLTAATDNTTQYTFSTLFDGSAIPDAIVKFAAVIELADNSLSSAPHISFVLNDLSIYGDLVLAAGQTTQTVIEYDLTFSSLTWDELSATDKAIFEAWLEDQVVQTLQAQGVDVQTVDFVFASGSIIASVTVAYTTDDSSKALASALSTDATAVISTATTTPIQFADRAPETITRASVGRTLTSVTRQQSAPIVVSASEASSTNTSLTVSYEVAEANTANAVTTLYILPSTTELRKNVLPGTIKADTNVQTFAVSGTTGSAVVTMDTTVRTFLYVVAENNATSPVLSTVYRIVSEPLSIIMPASIPISGTSGYYQFASQSGTSVVTDDAINVYTSAASGTAYLLLYDATDSNSIPSTAPLAKAEIDGGASNVSAALI